jgi:thiol:disulfide interchange protein DsbC
MIKNLILGAMSLIVSTSSLAFDNEAEAAINDAIAKAFSPNVAVQSIVPIKDAGLYEVVIENKVFYFSADAGYLIQGNVYALNEGVNLTEKKQTEIRKDLLSAVPEKDMIIYSPEKVKHTITVFTDIDCGYCRKLHEQVKDYNDLGIRVRYLAYPRGGIDSQSYDKAVDVWCAEDRNEALTAAKRGQSVKAGVCNAPVREQFQLGKDLGINGTPAIFLESGMLIPGYVAPERLSLMLEEK